MLQIHVMRADGSGDVAITAGKGVHWAPYWHPTKPWLIWTGADHSDPTKRPNYDLWIARYEPTAGGTFAAGPPLRLTDHEGADVLPSFSPDGTLLMWTASRAMAAAGRPRASSGCRGSISRQSSATYRRSPPPPRTTRSTRMTATPVDIASRWSAAARWPWRWPRASAGRASCKPADITVFDPSDAARERLAARVPGVRFAASTAEAVRAARHRVSGGQAAAGGGRLPRDRARAPGRRRARVDRGRPADRRRLPISQARDGSSA